MDTYLSLNAANMFSLVLLCTLLHQARGYSIKMQGQVEIGQELAVIFQDLVDQYLVKNHGKTEINVSKLMQAVNDMVVNESPPHVKVQTRENKNSKSERQLARKETLEAKDEKKVEGIQKEVKEKTFLEEIAGRQEKMHVYGKHREDRKNSPFNNINV